METEELCSINISPLVSNLFAIQWSPDNQISIITEKGIHILQLEPSPMSPNPHFKFVRSFIYPFDSPSICTFTNGTSSSVRNLIHEDTYSLLNNSIASKLNGKLSRITKVAWSPKKLISPSQCLLAVLNSRGAVELLHKTSNNWYSVCDVSLLRFQIIQNEIKVNHKKCHKNSNTQNAMTAEGMRKLQACSMAWSEFLRVKDTVFAYFSVAYSNGDISIWKVPKISNLTKKLELTFLGTIYLNDILKANVLHWITIDVNEYLIVIGYLDGRIWSVKLTENSNDLQIVSIEKYVDPDYIAINYLYKIPGDESDIKILAAKGSFLLTLCVDSDGKLKSIRHLHVKGFTITGVIPTVAQQFFITTQDSRIFIIDVQSNDLINTSIKSNLPQTHVQCLGLACSLNKVIFVNITSPNTIYDHLVTREPSVMHIFTLKGAVPDPLSIIDNSTSLGNIWDCIEVLRLKAIKVNDPCTILYPIPKELESLSLYKLQVSMWMTVLMNVCATKRPISNIDYIRESKMTEAVPLISAYSACTYLENSMKKNTPSEDQTSAIYLLRKYLATYLQKKENINDIDRRVREVLDSTRFHEDRIEQCNICGEIIEEWQVRSCPRGHKLSRCCMTLLQITLLNYCVCPICNQIFHPCLEDVYEEPRCQLCDVPILHNSYDFDVKESELYGRNLSLSQIDVTESSRDSEHEEPSDRQRKNKWNTSSSTNTYSIIVNNDDESGKITEKWEEF